MGGRWRTCGDERVCEACQSQDGGHWTGEAGVPPHPGCTNPDGCRCYLISDEDIAAGVNHLLRVELTEESGDPSIIAKARIVPAQHARIHGDLGATEGRSVKEVLEDSLGVELEVLEVHPIGVSEEEWRSAPLPLMCSGFLGDYRPPPPPAPWWRVLVWLVRDVLERIRGDIRFRWDRAARNAAEELERSRDDANRD